ncbi:enolase C-terminal domain-like protein [Ruania zhangjianzhongii]|uniref:enolase C-terminal domain-like protein n=1 Tax=Ruania zhangjianzhongii TaxID=2603206 RepID=UPI0011C9D9A9|nr:enolase C-terminal domain-like protein [Ruania zhangjianzhongii]
MSSPALARLADERLTAVEPSTLGVRYPRTVGRNARLGSHGSGFSTTAITLRTHSGHSGWGLVEGGAGELQQWVGRPVGELFDSAVGVLDAAAAPLDFALHDLAARILAQPAHELLGGHGEPTVSCYSGAIYFDDLDPEDTPRGIAAVLANCAADWAAGYRAVKLKIGRGYRWMDRRAGFARDIEVTRAVREAYPAARILVDANNGYTPAETVEYLRAVSDCGLFWIEEPFQEEMAGLGLVREYLRESGSTVLVADGEFEPDEQQVLELARLGLVDVLLMDVISYGLTAWRRVMPILAEIGVAASPHAWGQPVKTAYAAQLAAGLGNVLTVEGVPGRTDGVDAEAFTVHDGAITVPDTVGFGLSLTGRRPHAE